MGVKIGQVDAVVPEGNAVRLDVTYDSRYTLPARGAGRDRHPHPGRRPFRPGLPGVRRGRARARGRRRHPDRADQHPDRARPDVQGARRRVAGTGPGARRAVRAAEQRHRCRREGARGQRCARRRGDPEPVGGRRDLQRQPRPALRERPVPGLAQRDARRQRPARQPVHRQPRRRLLPARGGAGRAAEGARCPGPGARHRAWLRQGQPRHARPGHRAARLDPRRRSRRRRTRWPWSPRRARSRWATSP